MRTGDISLPVSAWPHFTIRPFSVTTWLQMKRFYSVLGLRNIPLCAWATLSLFARVCEQPGWRHSGSSVISPRPESLWYANRIQWRMWDLLDTWQTSLLSTYLPITCLCGAEIGSGPMHPSQGFTLSCIPGLGDSHFSSLRNLHNIHHSGHTNLHSLQQSIKFQFPSHLYRLFYLFSF